MDRQVIQLPVVLVNVSDKKDRSCVLRYETRELTNNEFAILRDRRDMEGWLAFAPNEVQPEEIPEEDAEVGSETPSQKLRKAIYVLWKQRAEKGETTLNKDEYYKTYMEKIRQNILDKLD